jgi:predicted secreted protein
MADEKGLSVVVKVGNIAVNAATFDVLEGQVSGTFDGSVSFADSTAKDNAGWDTSVATTRSGRVSVSGNVRLGVAVRPRFELLRTAWLNGTTHDCQIIYDAAGNGFRADFYVSLQITGEVRDLVKYQIEMTPAAALVAVPPPPPPP